MTKQRIATDDWIHLVNPPRKWRAPPLFYLTAHGLEEPRIIPLQAHVDHKGYNDVLGKVRGKNLIRLIFTVPTVRLKHKNREWTETEQIYLLLPFPDCRKDRGEAASTSGKTFEIKERKTLRRSGSASKTDSRIDIEGTWPFKAERLQTLREDLHVTLQAWM